MVEAAAEGAAEGAAAGVVEDAGVVLGADGGVVARGAAARRRAGHSASSRRETESLP